MRKFSTNLALAMLVAMIGIIATFSIIVDRVVVNFYLNTTYDEIERHTALLSDLIIENGGKVSASFFKHEHVHGMVVLDQDQKVIFKKNTDENTPPLLTDADWKKLDKGKSLRISREVEHHELLAVVQPIRNGDKNYGYMMMVTNSHHIVMALSKIRLLYGFVGIGAILISLLAILFIVRKFTSPIQILKETTETIAKGDLSIRIEESMYEELEVLGSSINKMVVSLEEYDKNRKEFFANVSHELRTPLTYLEGYVKMLEELPVDEQEERNRVANVIHDEIFRMKQIIGDLFDLAQLEEKKLSLTREWIDLNEVVMNVYEITGPNARKKGVNLDVVGHVKDLVYLDGYRIQQVVFNLVENAIRYTEKGDITIRIGESDDSFQIEILDTGMGIPDSDLPFIFDRFYRVEKSRSRDTGGTGLGLAIAKRLVEVNGGQIFVESECGLGTKFTIVFPKVRN